MAGINKKTVFFTTIFCLICLGIAVNEAAAAPFRCVKVIQENLSAFFPARKSNLLKSLSQSERRMLLQNPVNPEVKVYEIYGKKGTSVEASFTYKNSEKTYAKYNQMVKRKLALELHSIQLYKSRDDLIALRKLDLIQLNPKVNSEFLSMLQEAGHRNLKPSSMDEIVINYRRKKIAGIEKGVIKASEVIEPSLLGELPDGRTISITYGAPIPDGIRLESCIIDDEDFLKMFSQGRLIFGGRQKVRINTRGDGYYTTPTFLHDFYHLTELYHHPEFERTTLKKAKQIFSRNFTDYYPQGYYTVLETLMITKSAEADRLILFPQNFKLKPVLTPGELSEFYKKMDVDILEERANRLISGLHTLEEPHGAVMKDPRSRAPDRSNLVTLFDVMTEELKLTKQGLRINSAKQEMFRAVLARNECMVHNLSKISVEDWIEHLMGTALERKNSRLRQALCDTEVLGKHVHFGASELQNYRKLNWYKLICE